MRVAEIILPDEWEKFVEAVKQTIAKIMEAVYTFIDSLEPYQRFEIIHPRKKPRGSIRRVKHGRNIVPADKEKEE